MGRISVANLKKTIYYLQRNGIRKTWYAVWERLEERKAPSYIWRPVPEEELMLQRSLWRERGYTVTFSIVVPLYRTKPIFLRELADSLRCQTYPGWELILADATEDDSVERVVREIADYGGVDFCKEDSGPGEKGAEKGSLAFARGRIRYISLAQNAGIAENTNQALFYAAGDYVGLLDHDDVLTESALYEMAKAVTEGIQRGIRPQMLYSDEDKCNGDRTKYYEPNYKEDFNLDLLLSNNYICHFLVMDRELIGRLKFRKEYEGAQDYDLVLRAAYVLREQEAAIVHVPDVLYHWRCHLGSTAENPRSKLYAYEGGRRAIQDYADRAGWKAAAVQTAHVGFYALRYEGSVFDSRTDVGAVGGRVVRKGRVASGRLTDGHEAAEEPEGRAVPGEDVRGSSLMDGHGVAGIPDGREVRHAGAIGGSPSRRGGAVLYENLPIHYSGYLHRAILPQDAYAVDLRNIQVRPECRDLFERITGVPYQEVPSEDIFDAALLPEDCDIRELSLALGRALHEAGYRVLYLPGDRKDVCVDRKGVRIDRKGARALTK